MSEFHPVFIERLLSDALLDERQVASAGEELRRNAFVRFENFFEPSIFEDLCDEARRLLPSAKRKDFIMDTYDTPRNMHVVGGRTIFRHSRKLAALFYAFPIVRFLSAVVGAPLHLNRQEDAFMTINRFTGDGDTQGWHLDDGSHTVVYVFSAPEPSQGGALQYIPDWAGILASLPEDCDAPLPLGLQHAEEEGLVRSVHLQANTMYILKADTSLHRVSPLKSPSTDRTVLAAGYETQPVKAYTHTGADLYSGS